MSKNMPNLSLLNKPEISFCYISDLHCGSEYAIAIEGMLTRAGTKLSLNSQQKWLLKNYKIDLNEVDKCDILILLGDLAEGKQIKIFGNTLTTANTNTHVQCAVAIVSLAIDRLKPKVILMVSGTPYHVGDLGGLDYQVYQLLEAKYPSIQFIFNEQITMKIGQLLHDYAHAYPTVRNALPPIENLGREMTWECHNANKPVPDVFGRGHIHLHVAGMPRPNAPFGFTVPCQKVKDPYMAQKAYLTVREPDIGIITAVQRGRYFNIEKRLIHHW